MSSLGVAVQRIKGIEASLATNIKIWRLCLVNQSVVLCQPKKHSYDMPNCESLRILQSPKKTILDCMAFCMAPALLVMLPLDMNMCFQKNLHAMWFFNSLYLETRRGKLLEANFWRTFHWCECDGPYNKSRFGSNRHFYKSHSGLRLTMRIRQVTNVWWWWFIS